MTRSWWARRTATRSAETWDLLLTDLRMPGLDGVSLLQARKDEGRPVAAIVMTAHGSVDTAVKALHLGALDYVEKPFPLSAMEAKVEKALERLDLVAENERLKDELRHHFGSLIGGAPPMQRVFDLIRKTRPAGTSDPTRPELILHKI